MGEYNFAAHGLLFFAIGIICAKWALELGFSQVRQILFLIGGVILGPLMLLILYVFLINKAREEGKSGASWVTQKTT